MLSIVATSRNDDHGGNLLARMQHFVDGLAAQCRRHRLAAELVLVEWNPPPGRPGLAAALRWPPGDAYFSARIVQVPPEVHARLQHADRLPLFQMIAKNAGIRRARGEFVLATNIDILFSDALVLYLRDSLRPGRLYRVDRYDVPAELPPHGDIGGILDFCERNVIRINRKDSVYVAAEGRSYPIHESLWRIVLQAARRKLRGAARIVRDFLVRLWTAAARPRPPGRGLLVGLNAAVGRLARNLSGPSWRRLREGLRNVRTSLAALRRFAALPHLHTNACGDFTLMSRQDWFALRGYPEWKIFSWHLDSVLLHQAHGGGIRIAELPDPMRIYHIEHAAGSGWTPDGEAQLFARIEDAGVPYLSQDDFLRIASNIRGAAKAGRPAPFNPPDWGLAGEALPELHVAPRAPHDGEARLAESAG